MFTLLISFFSFFSPNVKLSSGRSVTLIGNGPPIVFSTGLFGIMPRNIYSELINKLKKNITIISFNDFSTISKNDIEDVTNSIMVDKIGFISHSSFDINILKSKKINNVVLYDPIVNPQLNFNGLTQQSINNDYPVLIIRANKAYDTKVPIPDFLNPNIMNNYEDIIYDDMGHIDILNDFWADIAKKYGFWDSTNSNIISFNKWKKIPKSNLKIKRNKYRKFIVEKTIDFINNHNK